MTVYLVNTAIIPANFAGLVTVYFAEIDEIKKILLKGFISAIGHEATALKLTKLLGIEIKMNRLDIKIETNDILVAFQSKKRLEEGKIYSLEEMDKSNFVFKILMFK